MLLDCQLPFSFWGLAAEIFVYIKNRSPHAKLPRSTPFEHWLKKVPDLTNLNVFGYPCFVHVAKEIRKTKGPGNKLLPKAEKMIFVGYSSEKKAWKCYDPTTKTIKESIHVTFVDKETPINGPRTPIPSLLNSIKLQNSTGTNGIVHSPPDESDYEERFPPDKSDNEEQQSLSDQSEHSELDDGAAIIDQTDDPIQIKSEAEIENQLSSITHDIGDQHLLEDVFSEEEPPKASEVQYHPTAGKWIMEERPLKWTIDNLPAKRQRIARAGFNNQAAAVTKDLSSKYILEEPTYEQAMKSEAKLCY
jgi:hypothetical protein